MPTIVLHQWLISPFCGKVRRILEHKKLVYTTVEYNGFKARKAKDLTEVGKLPVIDYDGERIQDSSDIAAFLIGVGPVAVRLAVVLGARLADVVVVLHDHHPPLRRVQVRHADEGSQFGPQRQRVGRRASRLPRAGGWR